MKRFLFLFFASPLLAQQVPTFIQTYEVRVSNVDVIVTDAKGQFVAGLGKDDFEVLQDGIPQPITNFSAYGAESTTATAAPAAIAPPKRIVFVFDDLMLHPSARRKLLEAVLQLVNEVHGEDQVSIVNASAANKVVLPFTSDRDAIRKAMQNVLDQGAFRTDSQRELEAFMFQTRVARSSKRQEYLAEARRYASRVRQRVEATIAALRGLVSVLGPAAGRKVIILISSSLTAEPGREAFRVQDVAAQSVANEFAGTDFAANNALWGDERKNLEQLGASAAAAGVVIYALQPDLGFQLQPGTDEIERKGSAAIAASKVVITQYQQTRFDEVRSALVSLADVTGGKFAIGDREYQRTFQQITHDVQTYYSIGYRPSETGDGLPRRVVVRVKGRPDLVVRAHKEVVYSTPNREMNDLAAASLLYPREVDELRITAEAGKAMPAGRDSKVDVTVRVPIGNLAFVPQGDRFRAAFSVHFAVAGEDATFAAEISREQIIEAPAANLETAKQHTFTHVTTLVVPRGTNRIAVAVQDTTARLTSFKVLRVDVR